MENIKSVEMSTVLLWITGCVSLAHCSIIFFSIKTKLKWSDNLIAVKYNAYVISINQLMKIFRVVQVIWITSGTTVDEVG